MDEAMRASEARFHALVQNSSDIITLFDGEGTVLYQSPSIQRLLGYRPEDRVGRNVFTDPIVHPDDHAAKRAFFEAARQGHGTPVTAGFRLRHADGSWRDIEAVGQSFRHDPGVTGVVANYRDVTDRKRTEEALRESERRFQRLFEEDLTGNFLCTPEGRVLLCNTAFADIFGFSSADAALGTSMLDLYVDPAERDSLLETLRAQGKLAYYEAWRKRHDGTPIHVVENLVGDFNDQGELSEIQGYVIDDTDRRKAEDALRQQAQLLHLSYDAIVVWRIDGGIEHWNRGAEHLYGFRESEALGRLTHDLLRTIHPVPWPHIEATIREHGQWEGELRHFARDGHEVVVSARHQLVVGSDGIERILETNRDITDRKRAEEALAAAKTAAEAATEAKSRFIAALSHELRTPLTPVVAALDMLMGDEELGAAARDHLEMIQRNVALEIRLIDDLLDVTRIAKGKLKMVSEPVDAVAIVRESVRICSGELSAKQQTVTVEAPEAPCMVMGDSARLHQVFWNLITNAVKFTPEGGRIALNCRVEESDAPTLVVDVSDTGKGIEPENLTRVFAPFEQPAGGVTGSVEGLGLGLSICKAVVESHGGRIGVSSPGRGSGATFTVELPIAPAQTEPEPGALPPPAAVPAQRKTGRKLRILLVEDDPDTAFVMATGIEFKGGHDVMTAGSVKDALAAMDDGPFDLLLCDVRLPDGTGYDVMKRLVAAGNPIRGIVISGFGTIEDRERSRQAGFVEHLVKPVPLNRLLRTLERVGAGS